MNVVFVHGFGGASGGQLERALEQACAASRHSFEPLRWDAGTLRADLTRAGATLLFRAISQEDRMQRFVRASIDLAEDARARWRSALTAIPQARARVLEALDSYERRGKRFSLIGFSLGSQVLLDALCDVAERRSKLHRVVLVGSAAPPEAYAQLPPWCRDPAHERVFHVWSANDLVLRLMYPLMQGFQPAAGRAPVDLPGIHNVEVDAGHLSYPALARKLLRIAVGTGSRRRVLAMVRNKKQRTKKTATAKAKPGGRTKKGARTARKTTKKTLTRHEASELVRAGANTVSDADIVTVLEQRDAIQEKARHGALERFFDDVADMISLVADFWKGDYREIPWSTILAVVFALLYVLNPLDLVPDILPVIGLTDDAGVVAACLPLIRVDLEKYRRWKRRNG